MNPSELEVMFWVFIAPHLPFDRYRQRLFVSYEMYPALPDDWQAWDVPCYPDSRLHGAEMRLETWAWWAPR